jgi:hypothetical protein
MGKLSLPAMLIGFVLVSACNTSPESALRKNTESLLKSNLNNASSYEFVSIENLDALSAADTLFLHYDTSIRPNQRRHTIVFEAKTSLLISMLRLCEAQLAGGFDCDNEKIDLQRKEYKSDSLISKNFSDQIQSILDRAASAEWQENKVGHKALFRYRASNAAGAKELREMQIYSDHNFNLYERFIIITP